MTFAQLLSAARVALRDTEGVDADRKLPTADALLYFNEAEQEACRRSRLLMDRTTPDICSLAVTAGHPVITISPLIVKIRAVSLVSRTTPLTRKYTADMDGQVPGWEAHTGTTDSYVNDYQTGKIRLYRIPAANDTLTLFVQRLPLADITATSGPEINPRFHPALVQYVIWRMRSIEDTELYDPRKAALAGAEFEREFGPKRSASNETYEDSQPYAEWE